MLELGQKYCAEVAAQASSFGYGYVETWFWRLFMTVAVKGGVSGGSRTQSQVNG